MEERLLGRLALQAKLITLDQLARAVRAQGLHPDQRIGEILVAQGALSAGQLDSLLQLQRRCLQEARRQRERPKAASLDATRRPRSHPGVPIVPARPGDTTRAAARDRPPRLNELLQLTEISPARAEHAPVSVASDRSRPGAAGPVPERHESPHLRVTEGRARM